MAKQKPYSEAELKVLIKAYERDEIRKAIHENNEEIEKIANQMERKTRGVENQLLGFRFIEKFLNGDESKRKRYSKTLFKVWMESGIESKLGLPREFTEADILAISSDRMLKLEVMVSKAWELYDLIKTDRAIWSKQNFPQSKGGPLQHFDRWLIQGSAKKKDEFEKLPPSIKSVRGEMAFRDFKKVIQFAEQLRLMESLAHDPVFEEAYENYEQKRESEGRKQILDETIRQAWIERHDGPSKDRVEAFTSVWEQFQPLKDLTTESNMRAVQLDPDSGPKDIYVSQHVSSQGPKYLPIGEVMRQQTFFEVPAYQRSYEWDRSNVEILREDLDSCTLEKDAPPVFLGTLLFQVGSAGSDATEVLDGQQRMLTIILFCIWICRLLLQDGQRKLAELIVKTYLGYYDDVHETLTPKFKPDPRDQASLKALLSTVSEAEFVFDDWADSDMDRSSNALEKQFKNIDDVFGRFVHSAGIINSPHAVCSFLLRLLQVCHVCRFVLAHKDDPFDTFQRLNYRGKKLQNADLVRSVVLKKCALETMDDFYRDKWRPVEELVAVNEPTDPHAEYKKSKLDKFFTCFAKTRKPGTKKNQSVNELNRYWSNIDSNNVSTIPEELTKFAFYYKLLYDIGSSVFQESIDKFGIGLSQDLAILAKAGPPDDFGPFVIGMLEALALDECSKSNARSCTRLLSSWIVRNSICAPGASTLFGLQRVFNLASWDRFRQSGFDPAALFKLMDKKEFNLGSLTDDEFRLNLVDADVYSSKISHCLVLAADTSLREYGFGRPFKKVDKRHEIVGKFQIDHVAPQKFEKVKEWSHLLRHKNLIHTIGNLVAIETRLNQEAQTEGFEERALRFHDESVFKMAKDLREQKSKPEWKKKYRKRWGHEMIRDRSRMLADILVETFEFPYEDSQYFKGP